MHEVERNNIASYLIKDGWLDKTTAMRAMQQAKQLSVALAHYLVSEKLVSSENLFVCCQTYFDLPVADLSLYQEACLREAGMNRELVTRYRMLPLRRHAHALELAITDPTDESGMAAIRFHTGLPIHPVLTSEAALERIIQTHCNVSALHSQLETTLSRVIPGEEQKLATDNEPPDEPIINLVNQIIREALQKQCSDIHLEPYEQYGRIRLRRDGLLYEAASIPLHLFVRVITRLKIMAHLNIAERRLPQDGRVSWRAPEKIDIRLSTCPTIFGEKMVLRLLHNNQMTLALDQLGLSAEQKDLLLQTIARPQGLLLVTGPTGSGKTITLYSILQCLNQIEKNISTVEDPVEIELPGINQINIHPRIGLDFATALRTFLRQDPDIMMVGEIRDQETAAIAVQAAQTGHLVLSTLHTNNAMETLSRLQSIGIPIHQVTSSLTLIIAQRLIRKRCPCQTNGCQHCYQGYYGRTGIFELLPLTNTLAHQLLSGNTPSINFKTLWQHGMEKVAAGITNQSELLRVIGHPHDHPIH